MAVYNAKSAATRFRDCFNAKFDGLTENKKAASYKLLLKKIQVRIIAVMPAIKFFSNALKIKLIVK